MYKCRGVKGYFVLRCLFLKILNYIFLICLVVLLRVIIRIVCVIIFLLLNFSSGMW